MIRLLLETATDVCSVAVADGTTLLAERTGGSANLHSSHLTIFIAEALEQAGLTLGEVGEVVLSDGPGSYTSLRVGAATAKGLCVALPGLALRTVPTLAALALASGTQAGPVLATLNSRRGEVFGQLFDFGARTQVQGGAEKGAVPPPPAGLGKLGPDHLRPEYLSPQNVRLTEDDWFARLRLAAGTASIVVCGPGQERVRQALTGARWADDAGAVRYAAPLHCAARHLLAPAAAPAYSKLADVAAYEPFYLNAPFVTKSKKKLLGR